MYATGNHLPLLNSAKLYCWYGLAPLHTALESYGRYAIVQLTIPPTPLFDAHPGGFLVLRGESKGAVQINAV